jgi:hypothetical protein
MAHFCRIDENNIVQEVHVINNDDIDGGEFPASEKIGQAFQESLGLTGNWLQCSYNGSFRGAYPGPGWIWIPKPRTKDGGIFQAQLTDSVATNTAPIPVTK